MQEEHTYEVNQETGEILGEGGMTGYEVRGEPLDDDTLLAIYAAAQQNTLDAKEHEGRLEMEILRRMERSGATAIPSETFICEVKSTDSYDQSLFVPFKELLNEQDLAYCYEPEWTEAVIHPARFATTKLKSIANKYGGKHKETFDKARIPGAKRLSFKRREEK